MYTYACTHVYVLLLVSIYTYVHRHVYLVIHIHVYMLTSVCIHLSTYLSIYLDIHICIHTCIYIYGHALRGPHPPPPQMLWEAASAPVVVWAFVGGNTPPSFPPYGVGSDGWESFLFCGVGSGGVDSLREVLVSWWS